MPLLLTTDPSSDHRERSEDASIRLVAPIEETTVMRIPRVGCRWISVIRAVGGRFETTVWVVNPEYDTETVATPGVASWIRLSGRTRTTDGLEEVSRAFVPGGM